MANSNSTTAGEGSRAGPGRWGFLLSHHQASELDRCWSMRVLGRRLWLCARCSGLYPVLLAVVAWQLARPIAPGWYDAIWLSLPALPALIDWTRHRLGVGSGGNWRRCLTGAGLGLALGRTVYLNMVAPWNRAVQVQLGALSLLVVVVEAWRWQRGRR